MSDAGAIRDTNAARRTLRERGRERGRKGGWACFQSTSQGLAHVLEELGVILIGISSEAAQEGEGGSARGLAFGN